jgi:hypothetical protein
MAFAESTGADAGFRRGDGSLIAVLEMRVGVAQLQTQVGGARYRTAWSLKTRGRRTGPPVRG